MVHRFISSELSACHALILMECWNVWLRLQANTFRKHPEQTCWLVRLTSAKHILANIAKLDFRFQSLRISWQVCVCVWCVWHHTVSAAVSGDSFCIACQTKQRDAVLSVTSTTASFTSFKPEKWSLLLCVAASWKLVMLVHIHESFLLHPLFYLYHMVGSLTSLQGY